jgi:myo-inositol-1(or 4)-monophosphatase
MNNNQLLKHAEEAALAAGNLLMKYFRRNLKIKEKPDAGIVTQIDLATEKLVISKLKKADPRFLFLAEETHPEAGIEGSDYLWIIDPLDGTTNYVHGFPFFSVSIAAQIKGRVEVGVVYHPPFNEMYSAIRGNGAYLTQFHGTTKKTHQKLRVSKTKKLSDSLLTTGFTYRKKKWLHTEMEAFERLSIVARAIRRPGSAALDLAYTARGVFDGFWERGLSPWDIAAGALLVTEAGGKVSDFQLNSIQLDGREILASNGKLHKALSATIEPESCPL